MKTAFTPLSKLAFNPQPDPPHSLSQIGMFTDSTARALDPWSEPLLRDGWKLPRAAVENRLDPQLFAL